MVCGPNDHVGIDLIIPRHKINPIMENLHNFYNHRDIPWVNLIWRAYYSETMHHMLSHQEGLSSGKISLPFLIFIDEWHHILLSMEIPLYYGMISWMEQSKKRNTHICTHLQIMRILLHSDILPSMVPTFIVCSIGTESDCS